MHVQNLRENDQETLKWCFEAQKKYFSESCCASPFLSCACVFTQEPYWALLKALFRYVTSWRQMALQSANAVVLIAVDKTVKRPGQGVEGAHVSVVPSTSLILTFLTRTKPIFFICLDMFPHKVHFTGGDLYLGMISNDVFTPRNVLLLSAHYYHSGNFWPSFGLSTTRMTTNAERYICVFNQFMSIQECMSIWTPNGSCRIGLLPTLRTVSLSGSNQSSRTE